MQGETKAVRRLGPAWALHRGHHWLPYGCLAGHRCAAPLRRTSLTAVPRRPATPQRARAAADRGDHQGPQLLQLHGERRGPSPARGRHLPARPAALPACCAAARAAGSVCSAAVGSAVSHLHGALRHCSTSPPFCGCVQVWEWRWRCIQVGRRFSESHRMPIMLLLRGTGPAAAPAASYLCSGNFLRPAGSGRGGGACTGGEGAHAIRGHRQPEELPAVEPPAAPGAGAGPCAGRGGARLCMRGPVAGGTRGTPAQPPSTGPHLAPPSVSQPPTQSPLSVPAHFCKPSLCGPPVLPLASTAKESPSVCSGARCGVRHLQGATTC